MRTGVALTFTSNIVLPDGSETLPGVEPIADSGICRAALRDLALAFPDVPKSSVRIADLGCLEGGHSAAFARAGYDVTGYEVRRENILCCNYVADHLGLPNLKFVRSDVRDVLTTPNEWDAVFCCGLLYHLEDPVDFIRQLGLATKRMLIVQTHISTHPDTRHEGHRGHWYEEGTTRWSSWENKRSFWLTRDSLLTEIKGAGFNLVYEQADFHDGPNGIPAVYDRSMFVGVKV